MYFTGDVTYPFDHGLSYSNFEYAEASLSKTENVTGDDIITVSVDVKNSGDVPGYEVVQAYAASPAG